MMKYITIIKGVVYGMLFFLMSTSLISAQKKGDKGFAFEQNARLGRGVNILSGDPAWKDVSKARMTENHFKIIKEAGFSNVRIVMNPFKFAKSETDYTINSNFFKTLDWAINQALSNDLMAIVDFHEHHDMQKDPLGNKAKFLAMWKQIAIHCKDFPKEVLFETCNEPNMKAAIWNEIHKEAHQILRESNPKRTILVGTINGNQIKFLKDLELPIEDSNIIVSIHYYFPIEFTHQGAEWSEKNKNLSGIEWTNKMEEEQAIKQDFDLANEWSKANNRPLHLGEFGVYQKTGMDSRIRWTKFVAREAEARKWSWSYWEFNAGFGIFDMKNQQWKLGLLDALIPSKKN